MDMTNSTVTGNRGFDGAGGVLATSYGDDVSTNISDTTFTDNAAGDPAPSAPYGFPRGGALDVTGAGALQNLTITGNTATETFGAYAPTGFAGGANLNGNDQRLSISDSTISHNDSGAGGGGLGVDAARVTDTTVADNQSQYAGGAYVEGGRLENVTVSGNKATGGGGLEVGGSGNTRLINSTVSGNQALGGGSQAYSGLGGGVLVSTEIKYSTDPGELKARASTIADNTAAVSGGNLYAYQENAVDDPFVQLRGTILANGTAPGNGGDVAQSQGGSIQAGFSLIESAGGITIFGDPSGTNLIGVDPELGPLANNGGPTQTRALDPTSPAVDASQAFGLSTDQRGSPRTVDSAAANTTLSDGTDIGAYELQDENATGDDDVNKPEVEIKAPKKLKLKPGRETAKAKVKFSAKDDRTGAKQLRFECKLDKGRFSKCSSPLKLKLDKGRHKVQVRATDAAGNTGRAKAKIKVVEKRKKR
jgi:hypothetical protein